MSDTLRLDRLSDPTFKFGYSIRADGMVILREPNGAICNDLRAAIDYAGAFSGEIPFCPVCKSRASGRVMTAVTEEHRTSDGMTHRWECPVCKTSFLH